MYTPQNSAARIDEGVGITTVSEIGCHDAMALTVQQWARHKLMLDGYENRSQWMGRNKLTKISSISIR